MELSEESFIEIFRLQLEGDPGDVIKLDTKFRELGNWDSLTGMAVQMAIKDSFDSKIPDQEFINAGTVGDLYNLTKKFKEN